MAEGGSGRGPTSTAYEYSPELAMIETKMRSLLSRNERRVLRKLAQAYASAQLNINQFVEALLHLLSSTPEKVNTSHRILIIPFILITKITRNNRSCRLPLKIAINNGRQSIIHSTFFFTS